MEQGARDGHTARVAVCVDLHVDVVVAERQHGAEGLQVVVGRRVRVDDHVHVSCLGENVAERVRHASLHVDARRRHRRVDGSDEDEGGGRMRGAVPQLPEVVPQSRRA